jgi:hypothetical protein
MSDQTSRRARQYTRYTGADRQAASRAIAALKPGEPLIPTPADHAQLLLEAEVFAQVLNTHAVFTEYPFGIASTEPSPAGIRLHIEDSVRRAQRVDNLLTGLLPCWEPGSDVHGIHGLRIRRRTSHGIELHRLAEPTRIWLTGPSRRCFDHAEADLARRLAELGWQPCWLTPDTLTEAEARWAADHQPLIFDAREQAAAWLASGLLRRLGLFHQVAVPQLVTGYRPLKGGGWILNLDYLPDTALRLGELVEALTDPTHGLPLALQLHRELNPDQNMGILLLMSPDGTGTLELRYDRTDPSALREHTALFTAIRHRISTVSAERPLPATP